MSAAFCFKPLGEWGIFPALKPAVIAGPCSAESREQMLAIASALAANGIGVFRAGLWKPRTRPGCFEGVGQKGLPWMKEVQERCGLKVCTEVASATHVQACLEAGIDMLWIGARTTVNPFLMQEIADALRGVDIPVLVKNPVSPDIALWSGAIERILEAGVSRVGLVHRGFADLSVHEYRNAPLWQLAVEMHLRYPQMPVFCDPSHIAGDRAFVSEIAQQALNLGMDGLMVEVHNEPAKALSDASQQLEPAAFAQMMDSLNVRDADSDDSAYQERLRILRSRIDEDDRRLLEALADRMETSRLIGKCKREKNVAIVQTLRWEEVLERNCRTGEAMGLDRDFVSRLFNTIHDASVREQNQLISSDDQDN